MTLISGDFDDAPRTDLAWIDTDGELFVAEMTAGGTVNVRASAPLGMPNGSFGSVRAAEVTGDDYADIILDDGANVLVWPMQPGALDLFANIDLYGSRAGDVVAVGDVDGISPEAPEMLEPVETPAGLYIGWQMPDETSDQQLEDIAPGGFHVEVDPGDLTFDLGPDQRSLTIDGLTAGIEHTISVWTTTFGGTSAPASIQATPEAPLGSISGTVTDALGASLEAINVEACAGATCETAATLVDGTFQTPGLEPGSYTVRFSDPAGVHIEEYWDDAGDAAGATPVTVVGGADAGGIDAQLAAYGSISGTVTDAFGTALAGIDVEICDLGGAVCQGGSTDGLGEYRVTDLLPGDYRAGFTDATSVYQPEFWDDVTDPLAATAVPVASGEAVVGIDAALTGPGSISGTAVDETAAPIAGIDVIACPSAGGPCLSDTTIAGGTYSITAQPGDYRIEFVDPTLTFVDEFWMDAYDAFAAAPVTVLADTDTPGIDGVLELAAVITGIVTDETGTPIAGANVDGCRFINNCMAWYSTTTDAAGLYSLAGLRPGDYAVQAWAGSGFVTEYYDDAYNSFDALLVPAAAGTTTPGIDIELEVAGAIAGTVTDTTGVPIAGVNVRACGPATCGSATTGVDGTYEVTGLRAGADVVEFRDFSGPYVREYYDDSPTSSGATDVIVAAGSTTPGIDAVLAVGGSIAGAVTDATGTPIFNAYVNACPIGPGACAAAWTDSGGFYQIDGLAEGDYRVEFDKREDGFVGEYYDDTSDIASATAVPVVAGITTSGIDATLEQGGGVTGTVTDSNGQPLATISVWVCDSTGAACRGSSTDASGSYTVTGLPPGDVTVRFSDWTGIHLGEYFDDASDEATATPVAVTAGSTITGIDAELQLGGAISGNVTGPLGAPVANADVTACGSSSCWTSRTNLDGNYTITGLPTDFFTVEFAATGLVGEYYDDVTDSGLATPVAVVVGATTPGIDAALVEGGRISGTVTDSAGAPLPDISVDASSSTGGSSYGSAVTDAAGTYTVTGLATDDYRVSFSDFGGTYLSEFYDDAVDAGSATPVAVVAGATTSGIDAALAEVGAIAGTVTDGTGAPLADISVNVYAVGGGTGGFAITDAAGNYTVTGLAPGSYRVYFHDSLSGVYLPEYWHDAPDFVSATPVAVTAGATTGSIDPVLGMGGTISGIVTDDLGAPLANAFVSASEFDFGGFGSAFADALGAYTITSLVPGDYRVSASSPTGEHQQLYWNQQPSYGNADPLAVSDGAISTADFALPRLGSITGVVTDTTGAPLAGIGVNASGASGTFGSTTTQLDGSYSMTVGPDSFVVSFTDWTQRYGTEYYDEATNAAAATPVVVTAGAETPGIDATLADAGSLSGTITDGTGDPLSWVFVRAFASDGTILRQATSNAQGEYVFPGLTGGEDVTVQFGSGDHVTTWFDQVYDEASATPVPISSGADTPGIDAVMVEPGAVSGTVTDELGAPLGGVEVWVCTKLSPFEPWDGCTRPASPAITDGSGGYLIAAPPNGDVVVFDDPTDMFGTEILPVALAVGPTVVDATLVDRAISGTVVDDATGLPLAGVSAQACLVREFVEYPGTELCVDALTGVDGTYVLGGLGTGEYRVQFSAVTHFPEYFGGPFPGTLVTGSSPTPTPGIDASLERGSTISGTVTDELGAPLPGITVTSYDFFSNPTVTTAADGTYTIGPFAAGSYTVNFDDASDTYAATSLSVSVAATTDETGADVTMRLAGGFSGFVTDERNGAPLEGAFVQASPTTYTPAQGSAVTAADGSYTITGLDPSVTYIIEFYGPPSIAPDGIYLGAFYQIEYWDDTTDFFAATPVPVVAGVTTPGYDAALALPPCDGRQVTVLIAAGETPTNGNDVILGTEFDDVVDGLAGDDTICTLGGNDTVDGGDGLDRIFTSWGDDIVDGGKGNDRIWGGDGNDQLNGGGGGDRLYGEHGNDVLRGGNGNDVLEGGVGSDELRGQNGSDLVYANSAVDFSTTDVDTVYGGGLFDDVFGDAGNDTIYGGNFADVLSGKSGDDSLYGNNGADTLRGGPHITGDYCNGGVNNSGSGDAASACETIINVP
ncbi:MAG: carboxypeptidase regulatory-like domain-containing protein [Ilumatobacter sp.]|uniref:carboxypeptidase regulatory-like domain-containing protein n=1 Tax=Ilumatobacter sp. TaxID=1967498 RepID=UPI00263857D8|nr:carboxypeptidase regulatory-like domain-containing protein [Ilumatobacter sp.]MDJ0770864.1 carboxypeptidase regulatory-like domain-containing protein [Ilumatobacter sp.]